MSSLDLAAISNGIGHVTRYVLPSRERRKRAPAHEADARPDEGRFAEDRRSHHLISERTDASNGSGGTVMPCTERASRRGFATVKRNFTSRIISKSMLPRSLVGLAAIARAALFAALPFACRARLARGFARAFPFKRSRLEAQMPREAARIEAAGRHRRSAATSAQAARGPPEPTVAREERRDRLSPRLSRLRKRTLSRGMACYA